MVNESKIWDIQQIVNIHSWQQVVPPRPGEWVYWNPKISKKSEIKSEGKSDLINFLCEVQQKLVTPGGKPSLVHLSYQLDQWDMKTTPSKWKDQTIPERSKRSTLDVWQTTDSFW